MSIILENVEGWKTDFWLMIESVLEKEGVKKAS